LAAACKNDSTGLTVTTLRNPARIDSFEEKYSGARAGWGSAGVSKGGRTVRRIAALLDNL